MVSTCAARQAARILAAPAAISHLTSDRILNRQPAGAVQLRRLDQRFDHGAVCRRGAEHQVGHDRVKR
jgi:hypothetical protein